MPSYLCLSVTFLDPAFHGRGDGGEPEWPPSPLRLFQALVASAAARWRGSQFADYAAPALKWLEAQSPPTIVAPSHHVGVPVRIAVPNNDLDVVAADWAKRREPRKQPAELKTMKTVRPTRMPDGQAVHYLWELADGAAAGFAAHRETLFAAARSLVALGWGVDLVAGNGRVLTEDEAKALPGERWRPVADPTARGLRVPAVGTLEALAERHRAFLGRVPDGRSYLPVPPLTAFAVVGYRRATDVAPRPFAAFALLKADGSGYRPFDPVRRAVAVAGMVRNAVAAAARDAGWSDRDVNTFVHGHTADGSDRARGADADQRFAYLPLPSLERRGPRGEHVGMIRRVLVTAPPGRADRVAWVRRALSGRELIDEQDGRPAALVSAIPDSDRNVRPYVGPSAVWSTVTPVVMPGYDDGDRAEGERLLRRAFGHAGLPPELVEQAEVEWRPVGFRAGAELAGRYRLPGSAAPRPACHVRVRWPVPVAGPLAVGACRYRGLGVLAAEGK